MLSCLRCTSEPVVPSDDSTAELEFFQCPTCGRDFARRLGRSLTYRWPHPVSLPLYCVLFDAHPVARVDEVVRLVLEQHSPERILAIVEEIEAELARPTQQVRDILDNPQDERTCREFLRLFAARARAQLR